VRSFEKYKFKNITAEDIRRCDNCLVVDNANNSVLQKNYFGYGSAIQINELEKIYLSNGDPIFTIFEVKRI